MSIDPLTRTKLMVRESLEIRIPWAPIETMVFFGVRSRERGKGSRLSRGSSKDRRIWRVLAGKLAFAWGTHLDDVRRDQQQVHDHQDGVGHSNFHKIETRRQYMVQITGGALWSIVQRHVISGLKVSHQIKPNKIEQWHDDDHNPDDAHDSTTPA